MSLYPDDTHYPAPSFMQEPPNHSPEPEHNLSFLEGKLSESTRQDLRERFTYHAPKPGQPARYQEITDQFLDLALALEQICPDSDERRTGYTLLQQARMMFTASIAINE